MPIWVQDLVRRLEELSNREDLTPDEVRELQDLARKAADIVCTVETIKEESK